MMVSADDFGGKSGRSVFCPAPRNVSAIPLGMKISREAASRTAGCGPAPALSSESCSFSSISPRKASVSTEEPGEGIPPPHKNTHKAAVHPGQFIAGMN